MVNLTRREWEASHMVYLRRRRCPECGSTMHPYTITDHGIVLAHCHYVHRDVRLARIAVPTQFALDKDEPPL